MTHSYNEIYNHKVSVETFKRQKMSQDLVSEYELPEW